MTPHAAPDRPAALSVARVDGILNINKPAGLTSHDVVQRVRRLVGQRRVGHAGTLDPLATGVLLVCLGQATRVAEYLMRGTKTYRATVRLGIATDTYDAEGAVTWESPGLDVSEEQIVAALARLRATTSQRPPPYSAVKQAGQRLYQLARRGIEVEPPPRTIAIESLDLLAWQPPQVTFEVRCSPGTYVRSLAHDLGQLLGVGGHLTALVRLRSGHWRIEEAITLETLQSAVASHDWTHLLHPLETAVDHLPRLDLDAAAVSRLVQGQAVAVADAPLADLVRVHAPDGALCALAQPSADQPGWWQPRKVFNVG
jgi:tRNA pseudouridine55 synthase